MASDKETRDIVAYLNDSLPANRRTAFEAKMQTDPTLRERVAAFQKVENSLKQLSALEQLRETKQETGTIEKPIGDRQLGYRVAASIAVVLLAGFSIYRFYFYPTQQLYADFYKPDTGARGGVTICPEALKPITKLYKDKKYDQALAQINQLPDSSLACVHYQKGLILLALSEPKQAINSFNQSITSDTPLIRQHSEWYLSLAYLKTRQKDLMRPLLQKIAKEPNHPKRQSAQRLLARLDT